jgi:hypothetical protein
MVHTALLEARADLTRIPRCLAQWCNVIYHIFKWYMGSEKKGTHFKIFDLTDVSAKSVKEHQDKVRPCVKGWQHQNSRLEGVLNPLEI